MILLYCSYDHLIIYCSYSKYNHLILLLLYRALSACGEKHKILIECYKTSLFGSCQGEMNSFLELKVDGSDVTPESVL